MGIKSKINWDLYLQHYDHIRDAIEKTIPGFENYNQRVRKPGGFYLPNSSRDDNFNTISGKAAIKYCRINRASLIGRRARNDDNQKS